MRELIALFEALEEKYSPDNKHLLNYLRDGSFDPYDQWELVCEWLDENGWLDAVSDIVGRDIASRHDLEDEDPELFFKLPEEAQKGCENRVFAYMMQHDPAQAPTTMHMRSQSDRLIPRNTWLVHFTDSAEEIVQHGFTRGIDDMTRLGLTTYLSASAKAGGGYSFAFLAGSRDASAAAYQRKYGRSCVMFQNSGVHAYHDNDSENQIIFWGKDVDPQHIVRLEQNDGDWLVMPHVSSITTRDVLFRGPFDKAVQWVIAHHQQYRRLLFPT